MKLGELLKMASKHDWDSEVRCISEEDNEASTGEDLPRMSRPITGIVSTRNDLYIMFSD